LPAKHQRTRLVGRRGGDESDAVGRSAQVMTVRTPEKAISI
jgi:hypothetical protein